MTLAACVSIIPEGVLFIWWLILDMSGPFLHGWPPSALSWVWFTWVVVFHLDLVLLVMLWWGVDHFGLLEVTFLKQLVRE